MSFVREMSGYCYFHDVQEVHGSDWTATTSADRVSVMSRVRHQVRGEQQRWKGAVQEQRRHIYDHHTMLN